MGLLGNEYKRFLDDMEKNIKDEDDLKYVKERFSIFAEAMLQKMQTMVDDFEKDIYDENDSDFDFEIICPYCNAEFFIDVDENKTEIQCPQCKNTIELDWNGDIDDESGCNGICGGCNGCGNFNDDIDEDDDM